MRKHSSTKNIFQNLTNFFRFWGIPARAKLFFSENLFTQNLSPPSFLNIFWRDHLQMKDKSISHISIEPDFSISPFFDFLTFFIWKHSDFFRKKIIKNRKRAKSKNPARYLCAKSIYLSFASGPVKKYWEMREEIHFEWTGFRKKIISRARGFPENEKSWSNFEKWFL